MPSKLRRVCMIVYALYDGDARVRREAETLAATGLYQVKVLALKVGPTPRKYALEGVEIQELNVVKYRGRNPLRYVLSYVHFTGRAFVTLTGLALRRAVDIVHVHNMPNFLLLAAIGPMLQRKRVILDIHDTMPETFAATFAPALRRVCLPILEYEERVFAALADKIIAVNDVQKDAILARLPRARSKTIVSLNVPDPRLFNGNAPAPGARAASPGFKLVYHGTVSGRLGVGLAVRAVARCAAQISDIELHIIGEGDAKESLIRSCKELGVADRVVFHKRLPLDELIPVVKSMDLGVVPLERNDATDLMLPVKLMECLSLGVAVVAPKLRAIQRYFEPDMLFLFDPGDVDSLCDAIKKAHDPLERLARLKRARTFLDRYGWGSHKANLLDLYRSVEPGKT
jgi:glycosyltransferase involved in cell wall biosynthesis